MGRDWKRETFALVCCVWPSWTNLQRFTCCKTERNGLRSATGLFTPKSYARESFSEQLTLQNFSICSMILLTSEKHAGYILVEATPRSLTRRVYFVPLPPVCILPLVCSLHFAPGIQFTLTVCEQAHKDMKANRALSSKTSLIPPQLDFVDGSIKLGGG